ncbi:TPA: hypothetical protein ACH3X1_006271 [Trebouxia sp. C0004]
MSGTLEHKRAATKVVKSFGLQADLRARAVVLVAADSTVGNSLRDLIQLNEDEPALKALVEEFFRGEGTGAAWRDPFVHYTHSALQDAFSCVSPVVYKDQSIGSVACISGNGLLVSSNHIFVNEGKFLKTTAFGGHPLELVVSFPYLDILLKGPKGPAFRLPSQSLIPGLPVMMLGFPKASITDIKGLDSPVAAKGHINAIPTSMEVASADYHGAMPASSGALVLFDTCTIAGVHTRALFHLDDEYIKTDQHEDAPRSRIEKDEQDMWWPQAGINAAAASHSLKRKAGTIECDQAVKGIEKMALHVNANIPHKDQLATFVPWQSIHLTAHLAGKCKARLLMCQPLQRWV